MDVFVTESAQPLDGRREPLGVAAVVHVLVHDRLDLALEIDGTHAVWALRAQQVDTVEFRTDLGLVNFRGVPVERVVSRSDASPAPEHLRFRERVATGPVRAVDVAPDLARGEQARDARRGPLIDARAAQRVMGDRHDLDGLLEHVDTEIF